MRHMTFTIELDDEGSDAPQNGSDDLYADDIAAILADAQYRVVDIEVHKHDERGVEIRAQRKL